MAERRRSCMWLALIVALWPAVAFCASAIDAFEFDDAAQAERYEALVDELRCPKCLNTNLAGSDAPIAADLRALVYRKVRDGESDEAIRDYLQTRYGDFVLYDPPKRADTALLWLLPALLLIVGIVAIARIVRGRAAAAPAELAPIDAARIEQLLSDEARKESPP